LRKARRREWSERHGGFVVEGGENEAPFMVACAAEPDELDLAAEVEAYTQVRTAAGMRVAPDSGPRSRRPRSAGLDRRALNRAADEPALSHTAPA
jgi:hypothetical protein